MYTRELDGLVFQEYNPAIVDKNCHFVRNERIWITTESSSFKSAVCGAYFGCQYPDNRNEAWNTAMYTVIEVRHCSISRSAFQLLDLESKNRTVDSNGSILQRKWGQFRGNKTQLSSCLLQLLDRKLETGYCCERVSPLKTLHNPSSAE